VNYQQVKVNSCPRSSSLVAAEIMRQPQLLQTAAAATIFQTFIALSNVMDELVEMRSCV